VLKVKLFVDTSAWYALVDANDGNHSRASEFLSQALADYQKLISTNHVIGETYTLIRSRLGHNVAWEFLRRFWQSHRAEEVFVTQAWEKDAYTLLEHHPDQDFSFVDGTSFVMMREQGISHSFTFDRHFSVAGFIALPSI